MSQRNETTVLVLALLITVGLLGGGFWWFTRSYDINLDDLLKLGSGDTNTSSPADSTPRQPVAAGQPTTNSFSQVQNVPVGLFNYGGSTTWAPLRRDVDPVIQSIWSRFKLRYTDPTNATPGSGSGIRMLLSNQLAFSQSSRPLNSQEYQQAQQRGFSLKEISVALEGLAIAVNPSLDIPGLTLAQIKAIYTGKIRNWNQVGGPDLEITPYSRRPEDGGTVEFFVDNLLASENFSSNVQFVFNTTEALRRLASNPGGIYYASAPEVVGQCTIKPLPLGRQANQLVPPYQLPYVPSSDCPERRNQLNAAAFQNGEYPITRPMFVIVKQNGQVDEQAGEVYANLLLTDQGQQLIVKAGFVRIR